MTTRPLIAITAGDVAGIGPEVVVRSLCDQRVSDACHPVVLCHPDILRRAGQLIGEESVAIDELGELSVNRRDLEALSSRAIACFNPAGDEALDVQPGIISAAAGDAATSRATTRPRHVLQTRIVGVLSLVKPTDQAGAFLTNFWIQMK